MPISLSSRWWINQLPKDLLPDYAKANLHTILDLTKTISRVLIITSENIHINSFMFEPLIDISLDELVSLYRDVSSKLVIC